jgi:hypothetical protein
MPGYLHISVHPGSCNESATPQSLSFDLSDCHSVESVRSVSGLPPFPGSDEDPFVVDPKAFQLDWGNRVETFACEKAIQRVEWLAKIW